jgi:hypothetical protein
MRDKTQYDKQAGRNRFQYGQLPSTQLHKHKGGSSPAACKVHEPSPIGVTHSTPIYILMPQLPVTRHSANRTVSEHGMNPLVWLLSFYVANGVTLTK